MSAPNILGNTAVANDSTTTTVRTFAYTPDAGADRIVLMHFAIAGDFGGNVGLFANVSVTFDGAPVALKGYKLALNAMLVVGAIAIDDAVSGAKDIEITRAGSGYRPMGYQFFTVGDCDQDDADLEFQYSIDASESTDPLDIGVTPETTDDLIVGIQASTSMGAFTPAAFTNYDGVAYGTTNPNSSSGNNLRSRLAHGTGYSTPQTLAAASANILLGFAIRPSGPPIPPEPEADPIKIRAVVDDELQPRLVVGSRLHMKEVLFAPERGTERRPPTPDPIKPSSDRVK